MVRPLKVLAALVLSVAMATPSASAAHESDCLQPVSICTSARDGSFALVRSGMPATIVHDDDADPGVARAASNLHTDLAAVAGRTGAIATAIPTQDEPIVIVGVIGQSAMIDDLARRGLIETDPLDGEWEAFTQSIVKNPFPGVSSALAIAGSDKRGAIYGVYDLSERAGVSPWVWWADVPVKQARDLFVADGSRTDAPAVKYRGIFLNDENPALYGWANKTFGGFNHKFYERIFDLILRLKGNYLWPAMWGKAFYDDDPLNAALAHEMGVVIGTSHHEPLMRAHVEWERYGKGEWDYTKNAETLREFWRRGIERMGDYESIVTIGMRGDGDEPMTENTAISLLEKIVSDQRKIIADETGADPSQTPQIWALYKEVQDYYDNGMNVPDDVTLLFADDNWGNIRRLPKLGDTRAGGYGVYYHFDYVGGPRNYKWLNTNQIERVWEQMQLAYSHGARQLWIVNVGDLKPMELPTDFFLDLAWDPQDWPLDRLPAYTLEWAQEQFGASHATEIASLLDLYSRYSARRKPELIDATTFSLVAFNESKRVSEEWASVLSRADALRGVLPKSSEDAYLQLVWHPIAASANLHELYRAAALNKLYVSQQRPRANEMADRVEALFEKDADLTRFFHEEIADGKWDHMMSQTHIGYTYWQQPDVNVIPDTDRIEPPSDGVLGVSVEGDARAFFGGDAGALPVIDVFKKQQRMIELFNTGQKPFRYVAETSAPWVLLSHKEGHLRSEAEITVGIDWKKVPEGESNATIAIAQPSAEKVTISVAVSNPTAGEPVEGYVSSDGAFSFNAANCGRAIDDGTFSWREIPNLGHWGSSITAFPATTASASPNSLMPRLEYDLFFFEPGEATVEVVLSPTLDFKGEGGLRYAISFDEEPPIVVNVNDDPSEAAWEAIVAQNAHKRLTRHTVATAGKRTLKLWLIDPALVFQRVNVFLGERPASYLGPSDSVKLGPNTCEGLAP